MVQRRPPKLQQQRMLGRRLASVVLLAVGWLAVLVSGQFVPGDAVDCSVNPFDPSCGPYAMQPNVMNTAPTGAMVPVEQQPGQLPAGPSPVGLMLPGKSAAVPISRPLGPSQVEDTGLRPPAINTGGLPGRDWPILGPNVEQPVAPAVIPIPAPQPEEPAPAPVEEPAPVAPVGPFVPVLPSPAPVPVLPSPSPVVVPVKPKPSPIPILKPAIVPPPPNKVRPPPPPPKPKPSPPPPPPRPPPPPPPKPRPPPPAEPLYISPSASFAVEAETWVDSGSITIPKSFMGMSHEWPHIEEIYNIPEYKEVIRLLNSFGGGPHIMRVGGGSTDLLTTVPGNEVWGPLTALYRETGTRYILGLNFEKGDLSLARRQMQAAIRGLPADAIVSFEIGNEPNFYVNKRGRSGNDYIKCCFIDDWNYFARELSCPNGPSSCSNGQFTGPVWGHVNMFPTTMNWFLQTTARWIEMTSVHWYKATAETPNTAATLLDEGPIRSEMANLKELVKVSNRFGKPLRVAEMNTISNSGRRNVSDVFAAALWTLDASLEVAQAGSVGVNLHQGSGQNLYTAIIRWYTNGRLAAPILRPPFYGMLLFQMAVRSNSKILDRKVFPIDGTNWNDGQLLKVWPLQDNESGELRWVIINKSGERGGRARVRINRKQGYASSASVTRLVARGNSPLTSFAGGVTIGGQRYGNGAQVQGKSAIESVGVSLNGETLQFEVYMPPGSAALVQLPRK